MSESLNSWTKERVKKEFDLPFMSDKKAAVIASKLQAILNLSDDQIVEIANDTHRAMPVDSDEQDEIVAIVRNCFSIANGYDL